MAKPLLIIDDDDEIRSTLVEVFSLQGYVVASARDGQEAISELIFLEESPGVIFLDWMMPRLNGPGFLKETRERKLISDESKIVVISAARRIPSLDGVSYILLKPLNLDELLNLAETHCRGTGAEKELASTNKSVLIVDDDPMLSCFYARVLSDLGYIAHTVSSGEQALEFLGSQGDVDVILVDYLLPSMSGRDFIRRAQQDFKTRARVFAFSSFSSHSPQADEIRQLTPWYLEKPSSLDEFRNLVESHF